MKTSKSTALAAVGIAGLGAAALWSASDLGIQDLPVGRSAQGESMAITVLLPTADGIAIGADVHEGQMVVGRVSALSLSTSGAAVQLSVRADASLPANTVATVELPSALGNPYIRLAVPVQPSPHELRNGDVIPPSQSHLGPQIETALATFGALMSRSGIDQLTTIVGELDTAFAGRSDKVRGLIDSMTLLTGRTQQHQGEFDAALALAAEISSRFAAEQQTVDGYLDVLPRLVAMLDVQRAKLQTLFASTTALASTANSILGQANMTDLVADAATVVDTLGSYNEELEVTLSSMSTFLTRIEESVHGDYMSFDGALDIPGTLDKLLTGGILVNGTPIGGREAWELFLDGGY
ncbi:MAG: MlaD family protein [Actinomycetota bacterium]|nr:MlaD family protein [Actinomycetota bacterium]